VGSLILLTFSEKTEKQKNKKAEKQKSKKTRKQMKEVKHIKDTLPFEANGVKYHFNFELPISRFKEFQKLKTLLQFAAKDESELFEDFKYIYENVNGNQLDRMKVLTICHNNMHGIKNTIDSRFHGVFQLAALFINRENEDATKFDKALNELKIADWEAEGFAASSFFFLVPNLMKNFTNRLNEETNISLDKAKEKLKTQTKQ